MAETAVSFLEDIGFRFSQSLLRLVSAQEIPDCLVVKPDSPWPGSVPQGLYIIDVMGNEQVSPKDWPVQWHDFSFLRDVQAAGGYPARKTAQKSVFSFIQYIGRTPQYDPHMGKRIYQWIMYADFVLPEFEEEAQDIFFESLVSQGYVLVRSLKKNIFTGLEKLQTLAGLICVGFAFEGYEDWSELGLAILESELKIQVLPDGGHISRSPAQALSLLETLLDIRTMLSAAAYPVPEYLDKTIKRVGQALRFFRYHDKGFALFNGTQEGDPPFIDCVVRQSGVRGKIPQSLPDTGFEKITLDRTTIMMNAGAVPATAYSAFIHAAPLAFEMCYGQERIFVSCGSHPSYTQWQESLRATSAHNTAILDEQDAYAIDAQGHIARHAKTPILIRHEDPDSGTYLLEGEHDGYVSLNGFTHKRSIYLGKEGHDIRGEDRFVSKKPPKQPVHVTVRFHVHPRIMVSLLHSGHEALLRMPGGIGWRFTHMGGVLALEDSIYLGHGMEPRKTTQIVIHAQTQSADSILQWGMKREG